MHNKIFNAGQFVLSLDQKTYVMGILNVTPDSFSDGGDYICEDSALERAYEIQSQGADILDIGAQSTRPGHKIIDEKEELKKIIPVLMALKDKITIPISIDTFYPNVARECIKCGAHIINDVSGFRDNDMYNVMSTYNCGCIIMHDMQGVDIKPFFIDKLKDCEDRNIDKSRICFDPGIGFSKTYEENLYIINNLKDLIVEECGILIGASRKRVIGQSCGDPPFKQRTAGTIAAHTIAIYNGANIIRAHDVKEAVQAAKVADAILRS